MARLFLKYVLLCVMICLGRHASAQNYQTEKITTFPKHNAVEINPDSYLQLTFKEKPTLLNSGKIRIYDASEDKLVDELDMSIPPGPKNTRTPAPYDTFVYNNIPNDLYTVAKPDLDTTHKYQINHIGGEGLIDAYHFYPVLIEDNSVKIYPHHNRLKYGKSYYVQIEKGVLATSDGEPIEISDKQLWRFNTRQTPPAANKEILIVDADGSGDFTTVQGAIDFIPENNTNPVTIRIKNGTYNEIINCRNRHQVRFIGESREKVLIQYPNNGVFNTRLMSPDPNLNTGAHSIRAIMSVYKSSDITISDITLRSVGEMPAQAEALLVIGDKIIVDNVSIEGSGDALQATGRIYVNNSKIQGFGDNVLGYGAVYFNNCDFVSTYGPHLWIRNDDKNHGNILVNCTLRTIGDVETHIARAPDNHGIKYTHCEAILIDCKLEGIKSDGWGKVTDIADNVRYWEYNSTDLGTGKPIDIDQRHPASKQLTMEKDAELIKAYKNPAFALDGWNPQTDK